jgi:hypothetical protein
MLMRCWHIMTSRAHIAMDPVMMRRAHARAAELGISLAEYMRRLVAQDLGDTETPGLAETGTKPKPEKPKPHVSIFFDLIDEGPPTNIARDKDKMIGEAVWQEYLRETGRKLRRRRK